MTNQPLRILALDCATTTGWALRLETGIESGRQEFPLRRGESTGMRWIRFRAWLREMLGTAAPALVVYEAAIAHHPGANAAEMAYALTTRVAEECEQARINYVSLSPSALKSWATGNGGARKEAMKDAAQSRFPHYDRTVDGKVDAGGDEADALLLLAWVEAGMPEQPKRSAKRKVKTEKS